MSPEQKGKISKQERFKAGIRAAGAHDAQAMYASYSVGEQLGLDTLQGRIFRGYYAAYLVQKSGLEFSRSARDPRFQAMERGPWPIRNIYNAFTWHQTALEEVGQEMMAEADSSMQSTIQQLPNLARSLADLEGVDTSSNILAEFTEINKMIGKLTVDLGVILEGFQGLIGREGLDFAFLKRAANMLSTVYTQNSKGKKEVLDVKIQEAIENLKASHTPLDNSN